MNQWFCLVYAKQQYISNNHAKFQGNRPTVIELSCVPNASRSQNNYRGKGGGRSSDI